MKEIICAFDVDGTIISNTNGLGKEKLNIDVYNLMVLFSRMKNVKIIVWSGAGKLYAEQIVLKYGLVDYVSNCYGKHEYDESIYGKVDIAFDDMADFSLADKNIIVK